MSGEYKRAFELQSMNIGLISDYEPIIFDDEYFKSTGGHLHSLLSNFNVFNEVSADLPMDMTFELKNNPVADKFSLEKNNSNYLLSGPLEKSETGAVDKRSSIFGNMGIFSKITVGELEKRGIFSFHSTSSARVNPSSY